MPMSDVALLDEGGHLICKKKAYELSGENGILFKRDSGTITARPNKKVTKLNPLLHKN